MLRPAFLVGVYFGVLFLFSAINPEMESAYWITLDQFHDLIGVTACFALAFKNDPLDKGAIAMLWAYSLLLFVFDWIIPVGYVGYWAPGAALAIGIIFYRHWTDKTVFGGEETG